MRKKKSKSTPLTGWRRAGRALKWVVIVLVPAIATYYPFRPKLSVAPNVTLNETDPFSTAFTVSNSGEFFTVRNVKAGCDGKITYTATRPQTFKPVSLAGLTVREELGAGDSFTVPCIGGLKDNPDAALVISEANITVRIKYSVRIFPKLRLQRNVRFRLAQSTDHNFHWLPE